MKVRLFREAPIDPVAPIAAVARFAAPIINRIALRTGIALIVMMIVRIVAAYWNGRL